MNRDDANGFRDLIATLVVMIVADLFGMPPWVLFYGGVLLWVAFSIDASLATIARGQRR